MFQQIADFVYYGLGGFYLISAQWIIASFFQYVLNSSIPFVVPMIAFEPHRNKCSLFLQIFTSYIETQRPA